MVDCEVEISFPAVHWGGPLPLFLEVWMDSGSVFWRYWALRMVKLKVGLYLLISWRPRNNPLLVLCTLCVMCPLLLSHPTNFKSIKARGRQKRVLQVVQTFGMSDFISLLGDQIPVAKLGNFDKFYSCTEKWTPKIGLTFTRDCPG